jgi:hypothetical protein
MNLSGGLAEYRRRLPLHDAAAPHVMVISLRVERQRIERSQDSEGS